MKMIWERYIYKETLKVVFLLLISFFLLYIAVDSSIHMQGFVKNKQVTFLQVAIYYAFQFIKRADLLLPLAILVASIKVLRNMSEKHELLALQVAGLSAKRILRPLIVISLVATLCNFAIAEFFLPGSLKFTDEFYAQHLKPHTPEEQKARVGMLELKDGSRLAYQGFDKANTTFEDVFWIRTVDDIWRIKTLKLDREHPQEAPLATFVDHIARGPDGGLHKVASYPAIRLDTLKANSYMLKKGTPRAENSSITKLFKDLSKSSDAEKNKQAILSAQFGMKTARPFLSILAILAIAPFCLRFSRLSPALPLYTCGIFGVITYFIGIQAGGILVQNGILTSFAAIALPLVALLGFFTYRFSKI